MEPLPVPAGLEDRISELWGRARHRWLARLAIVLPLSSIAGVLLAIVLDRDRRPHSGHHHPAAIGWFVVIGLLLTEAVALFFGIRYARRRFKGQWVPLGAGLSRKDRRRVYRAVRRGEPSADQFHRYVETFTARKIALQRRRSQLGVPAAVIGCAVVVAVNWGRTSFLAWAYSALLVVIVVSLPRTIRVWRGADQYLRTVNIDPDALRRAG